MSGSADELLPVWRRLSLRQREQLVDQPRALHHNPFYITTARALAGRGLTHENAPTPLGRQVIACAVEEGWAERLPGGTWAITCPPSRVVGRGNGRVDHARVLEMARRMSQADIARALGVSRQAIHYHLRRALSPPGPTG